MDRETATQIVDSLVANLNGRSGFDTGGLDTDTLTDWHNDWVSIVMRFANAAKTPVWYETQERAFAPGIVTDWPKVIPHPTDPHGRLVKRTGAEPRQ